MQTEWQTVKTPIRLLWVCTVCSDLSVRKLGIITIVILMKLIPKKQFCPEISTYYDDKKMTKVKKKKKKKKKKNPTYRPDVLRHVSGNARTFLPYREYNHDIVGYNDHSWRVILTSWFLETTSAEPSIPNCLRRSIQVNSVNQYLIVRGTFP